MVIDSSQGKSAANVPIGGGTFPVANIGLEGGRADLKAIMVIHGIGQQQPFQPLDNFVNGLKTTLASEGNKVTTTHFKLGREGVFDHCLNVVASDSTTGAAVFRADVYEFYWAALCQGKASFQDVVRWLLVTGFTPLRRFAFNLPLLIQRAGQNGGKARIFFRLSFEFCRELCRLIYVSVICLVLAGMAWYLVARLSDLWKSFGDAFRPVLPALTTWNGSLALLLFLGVVVAAIALAASIPEQVRELIRLLKMKPNPVREMVGAFQRTFRGQYTEAILSRIFSGVVAGAKEVVSSLGELRRWTMEIRARRWFLPLSVITLVLLVWLLVRFLSPTPLCALGFCLSPIVHELRVGLGDGVWDLLVVTLLLLVALFVKGIFVAYLADIALYTTADENSAFFKTRSEILKEATRKLRALLRDPQYTSVAVAGHSLGSVIGYDAINWLRVETQVTGSTGAQAQRLLADLATHINGLPPEDNAKAHELIGQLTQTLQDSGHTAFAPVSEKEFRRLRTFITFGSPLNKVLYFFRSRVKVYETVRAHILNDLHGFRQVPDLLSSDSSIQDNNGNPQDNLYWVNIYSPLDPISARLVFYRDIHEHRRWFWFWGKCHVSYWHDQKFYREVLAAVDQRCGW